jgi:O-antigen ligase
MFLQLKNLIDHTYSRNVAFALIMGIFCVALGSFSTALLVASCVVLIFFNPKIALNKLWSETVWFSKKLPIILVFPIFYMLVVFTSFRGEDWLQDVIAVSGSYWQFLVIIPSTIGLYHLSKDVNFAGLFCIGCRIGLLFVLPLSLFQIYFLNLRPEGFLSNSLVFASLCVTAAGLAMIEWREDNLKARTWSWFMFAAGILAALLTFSRGILLPIGIIGAIALFYRFKVSSNHEIGYKTILIMLVGIFAILFTLISSDNGGKLLYKRIFQPIEMFQKGELFDRSIQKRVDMQLTGFHAFTQQPFIGYGIKNAVQQANQVSEKVLGRKTDYTYTHLHNDYLTHLVGGGIILLLMFILVIFMPVIITWKLRKTTNEIGLFYFALVLSGTYSTVAITNVVFRHDQLTTMFCVACMFIIVRRLQILKGIEEVRIPDIPTIMNGENPIGLVPEKQAITR